MHVNGTARPQCISRDVNLIYFKLGGLAMLASRNFIVT
jgi:predicted NodU family carbamoyl transferase